VGWVTVTAKAENSVTSRYSLQQGERTKVTHEVEVNVPARTRVTVFVHWKLVWHHGVVKMSGPAGSADVPFRFVHSLDYDRYTVSG
jgi:hypothetical protein